MDIIHKKNISSLSESNSIIADMKFVETPISEEQAKKIKRSIYMQKYRARKKQERLERFMNAFVENAKKINPIFEDLKWRESDESKKEIVITTKLPDARWVDFEEWSKKDE